MSGTNYERIGRALGLVKAGLAPFLEQEFKARYGSRARDVLQHVSGLRIANWQRPFDDMDVAALLRVMDYFWDEVFRRTLSRSERSLVNELWEIRNGWAHQKSFTSEDTQRALDSSFRLLVAVSAEKQANEVAESRDEIRESLVGGRSRSQVHSQYPRFAGRQRSASRGGKGREWPERAAGIQDKYEIVVIACAASKRDDAGCMRQENGKPVRFVAFPDEIPYEQRNANCAYARPDDVHDGTVTWRDCLVEYNREYERTGDNPLGLLPAYELYSDSVYRELVQEHGVERVFILSGGWGLISAAFLTPQYDITFSQKAEKWKRRGRRDPFRDLCHIAEEFGGAIQFFGGKEYVQAFSILTRSLNCRKVVWYNSATSPSAPGCELRRYRTAKRTNWHYDCARSFINGELGD